MLRQLAPEVSYRTLVALGIAGIQGLAVASFEKEDAERFLYFCGKQDRRRTDVSSGSPPPWLRPPVPRRIRPSSNGLALGNDLQRENNGNLGSVSTNGVSATSITMRRIAALRPIPHIRHQKMLPFSGIPDADVHEGSQSKTNLPVAPVKHERVPAPVTHRKSASSSFQAKQIISLNPIPLKKHGCGRSPLHVCTEVKCLHIVS